MQEVVYQALLDNRCLSIRYRKRGSAEASHYREIHPLALVQRGALVYLPPEAEEVPELMSALVAWI